MAFLLISVNTHSVRKQFRGLHVIESFKLESLSSESEARNNEQKNTSVCFLGVRMKSPHINNFSNKKNAIMKRDIA